jgi:GTPase
MSSMPVIAIVGRPNVGKSSLLNALVGKRVSIVQDEPGVTRDRVSIPLQLTDADGSPRFVELVDTGGYGFIDPDNLTEHIKHQIELAMSRANLVLFIVDTQAGLTGGDEEIAALLRRLNVKTLLIANKTDGETSDSSVAEFSRLGLGTPLGVSAINERNFDQFRKLLAKNVDLKNAPGKVPDPTMYVAIVGKRNAGKSTLVNSIAQIFEGHGDRVIVSEVPGTTRDSIDVRFEKEGKAMVVIDTAGVRKKRHMVTNDIEFYSYHRAQRSIRRADVVMLLIDATEKVSEPDKKLAMYISEQMKPVLIVVNKWDLAKETLQEQSKEQGGKFDDFGIMEEYRKYLDEELKHIDYAPIAFVTAKEGKNVQAAVDLAQHLFNQASERVSTSRLNEAVKQCFEEKFPSTPNGRRAKIYYATQTGTNPPTLVLFCNKPEYINEVYQRFMINRFRDLLPYPEVPIKLVLRGKDARTIAKEGVPDLETDDAPVRVKKSSKQIAERPRRHAGKRTLQRGPQSKPRPKSQKSRRR